MDDFTMLENARKSEENYDSLRESLVAVVKGLSKKTLVEVIKADDIQFGSIVRDIKNAAAINHHVLPNDLHVYQYVNAKNLPITYYFSKGKMLDDYSYQASGKEHTTKIYTGKTGLGFSTPGIGNSYPSDGIESYPAVEHIDVISFQDYKGPYLKPVVDTIATRGFKLSSDAQIYSKLTSYGNDQKYTDLRYQGDLLGLIDAFEPTKEEEQRVVSDMKELMTILKTYKVEQKRGFFSNFRKQNDEPFEGRKLK